MMSTLGSAFLVFALSFAMARFLISRRAAARIPATRRSLRRSGRRRPKD